MNSKHKNLTSIIPFDNKNLLLLKLFHFSLKTVVILLTFIVLSAFIPIGIREYANIYDVDAKFSENSNDDVDINSNIKLDLNQPIIFMNSENIIFSPYIEFDYELSDDKRSLTLKPKGPLLYENKYEIDINGIIGMSGLKLNDRKLTFFTKKTPSENKINLIQKEIKGNYGEFELSENKYIVPEVSKPKEVIEIIPKFTEGKYMDISIADQVMTLFDDGVKVNQFLISSGKHNMPTPFGTFSVKRKEENHWSSTYGLWMPYSMNFYGAYYIHELPYWPWGYREGEDHLGMRVSHGCIRLGVGPAEYVFDWSEIGTPIYIHN